MDILGDLLKDHGGDLLGALTSQAGFSNEQAESFLPAAGEATLQAVQQSAGVLDKDNLGSAGNVETMMGSIDAGDVASKAGIPMDLGSAGLKAILPMLLGLLGTKAGGLTGLLSMLGGGGGALGKLGSVGGGLGKLGGIGGLFDK